MSEQKQATPEQLERWKRLDELDKQKRLNRELKSLASHEKWLVNHIKETLGEERLKEIENQ